MNDHQKLQKRMKELGLAGRDAKEVWAVMNVRGLEAAFDAAAQYAQLPKIDELTDGFEFPIWNKEGIDPNAIEQMDRAVKLKPSVGAALMGDAHLGYGLPIGGVLVMEDAIMPYGIGVDIACQVRLTAYEAGPMWLGLHYDAIKEAMVENTRFGKGSGYEEAIEHPILDDYRWKETPLLRRLHGIAINQLGSSGGGNHFVEVGYVTSEERPLPRVSLLSHSGSRGVGKQICDYYTNIAKSKHPALIGNMKDLAWLDMRSEDGQEYWLSMQLAGNFADANHDIIHSRISKAIGLEPHYVIGSKHNFAWNDDGFYIHRKGATPAAQDQLGVIPGTMTHGSFIVVGKGNMHSIYSASHGAGRIMGRKDAKRTLNYKDMLKEIENAGIELIGGSLDEAPQAYKDPFAVMKAQSDLVDVVGMFHPKIVIMAGEGHSED